MTPRNNAGDSFKDGGIARKYGHASARAGQAGEQRFEGILRNAGITRDYQVWYSLKLPKDPRYSGSKSYDSDVDVAIASGNKLILVDVKNWAAGHHYWSFMGMPFKGVAPIVTRNGEWKKLSANMAAARSRYQANLPGVTVEAITIFIPTNTKGSLPSSVWLLRFPGGIKSYLHGSGINKVRSFLGKPLRPVPKIEQLLSRLGK